MKIVIRKEGLTVTIEEDGLTDEKVNPIIRAVYGDNVTIESKFVNGVGHVALLGHLPSDEDLANQEFVRRMHKF